MNPKPHIYDDTDASFDGDHEFFDELAAFADIQADIYEIFCEDPVVVNVVRNFERRSQEGMLKYGMSMAGNPLPLRAWLVHAIEEQMDSILYLQRALDELDAQSK